MDVLLENKVKSFGEVQGVQVACGKFGGIKTFRID
jgi:hypothetical protein